MQEQLDVGVGAVFTTSRKRPIIVAVITTVLFLVIVPKDVRSFADPDYIREYLIGIVITTILWLLFLVVALRNWRVVLRRPAELRLTSTGIAVRRDGRELTAAWTAVGQIRIDGDERRPWVVAWLDPALSPDDVPVPRRSDGAYKLFPIAHGQPMKRRMAQLKELRGAITGYGRRYLDGGF